MRAIIREGSCMQAVCRWSLLSVGVVCPLIVLSRRRLLMRLRSGCWRKVAESCGQRQA